MKIYDKVSWHYPDGDACPSLEAALRHFRALTGWLVERNLLSPEGAEIIGTGDIGSDFVIHERMLNSTGAKVLDECYTEWIDSLSYAGEIRMDILESCLSKVNNQ